MTVTDQLLENAKGYADGFDKGDLPLPPARIAASPFIPRKDKVRGFVYEVETGGLREVV